MMKKKRRKNMGAQLRETLASNSMKAPITPGMFEVREADEDFEKMFEQSQTCLDAVSADLKESAREHDVQHEIECPICQGPAFYSVSSYNGHRRFGCARCEISMME